MNVHPRMQPSPDGNLCPHLPWRQWRHNTHHVRFPRQRGQLQSAIAALPKLLKIDVRQGASREWVEATVRFGQRTGRRSIGLVECHGATVGDAFIEAVRRYSSGLAEQEAGWLRGLKTPTLGERWRYPSKAQRTLVCGSARKRSRAVPQCICATFHVAGRDAADPVLTVWRLQTAKLNLRKRAKLLPSSRIRLAMNPKRRLAGH